MLGRPVEKRAGVLQGIGQRNREKSGEESECEDGEERAHEAHVGAILDISPSYGAPVESWSAPPSPHVLRAASCGTQTVTSPAQLPPRPSTAVKPRW